MYTESVDQLYEIFSDILTDRKKLEEDGIKRYAVIYTTDVGGSEKQWVATYYSPEACIENANYNLRVDDDWTPTYVVDLENGESWEIEVKAILGDRHEL